MTMAAEPSTNFFGSNAEENIDARMSIREEEANIFDMLESRNA
jgi:hypothetical protein